MDILNNSPLLSTFFKIVGIYAFIWWLTEHFTSLFEFTWNSIFDLLKNESKKSLQEKYGQWAVVTGATDGIGKYYAIELAKRGMNVCLISRSESKLVNVASEIEKSYNVETKIIVTDFSNGQSVFENIKSQLQQLDIGILVNNVGIHPAVPDYHENIDDEVLWQIINVNTGAITILSKIVIPGMKLKKRGLILNVGSASQYMPLPLSAIYGASKSFTRSLSFALRRELAPYNVKVHMIIPMFVKTNITQHVNLPDIKNILFPEAKTYVESTMRVLGICSHSSGYLSHSLQFTFLSTIPEFLRMYMAQLSYQNFRKQYLRMTKNS